MTQLTRRRYPERQWRDQRDWTECKYAMWERGEASVAGQPMKHVTSRPFSDLEKAARRLLEICNVAGTYQDGCLRVAGLSASRTS
jgi:hypothetical protein